jgi:NADH:ubiquinone oxidoreductase subunit 6 (subunit J)
MALLASELINWSALWKICIAALIGGAGVVTAFGLMLLGIKQFSNSRSSGARTASVIVSGICAVFIAGAVVAGIYAMAKKPSSKKPAKKSAAITRTLGGSS